MTRTRYLEFGCVRFSRVFFFKVLAEVVRCNMFVAFRGLLVDHALLGRDGHLSLCTLRRFFVFRSFCRHINGVSRCFLASFFCARVRACFCCVFFPPDTLVGLYLCELLKIFRGGQGLRDPFFCFREVHSWSGGYKNASAVRPRQCGRRGRKKAWTYFVVWGTAVITYFLFFFLFVFCWIPAFLGK